jgi:hypothetical protein
MQLEDREGMVGTSVVELERAKMGRALVLDDDDDDDDDDHTRATADIETLISNEKDCECMWM